MIDEENFHIRLTQLRNARGVSARDMSLSIGLNPGYINNIESGKSYPSMVAFFYICYYLKITPQEFFDSENSNPAELRSIIEKLNQLTSAKRHSIEDIIDLLLSPDNNTK